MLSFCGIPGFIYPFPNPIFIHSFSFMTSGKRGLLFMLLVLFYYFIFSFHPLAQGDQPWPPVLPYMVVTILFCISFHFLYLFQCISFYFLPGCDPLFCFLSVLVISPEHLDCPCWSFRQSTWTMCHYRHSPIPISGWCLMSLIDIHLFPISGMVP